MPSFSAILTLALATVASPAAAPALPGTVASAVEAGPEGSAAVIAEGPLAHPVRTGAEPDSTPPTSAATKVTVPIPGGEYVPHYALTADPEPRVDIGAFAIDARPVTVGEFLDFVRVRPEWRRSRAPAVLAGSDYLKSWEGDLEPNPDGAGSRRPVTEVSWFAARAYCSWRGMRLPTTDEWEYVAGAGEESTDGFRDGELNRRFLDLHMSRPGPDELPAVGRTFRNAYGVWDLHGLVWEWTSDFNNQMLTGAGRDDQSLDRGLFCAAGSVGATDIENYAAFLRYAYRSSLTGDYGGRLLGFRCAASR